MTYVNFVTLSEQPRVEAQCLATDMRLGNRVNVQPLNDPNAGFRITVLVTGIEDRVGEIITRGEQLGFGVEDEITEEDVNVNGNVLNETKN